MRNSRRKRYPEPEEKRSLPSNRAMAGSILSAVGLMAFGISRTYGGTRGAGVSMTAVGLCMIAGGMLWVLFGVFRRRRNGKK